MGRLAVIFAVAVFAIWHLIDRQLSADIISTFFYGDAYAEFNGSSNFDSSTASNASRSAFYSEPNSYSDALLQWAWNGGALSGSSLITLEKTLDPPPPGGPHVGQTYLELEFEVDADTPYSISGTWETTNQFGIEDFMGWQILDSTSSQVDGGALGTPNLGISAEPFSSSGVLSAGQYTFIFESNLFETLLAVGLSQSGWTLNNFTIGNVRSASLRAGRRVPGTRSDDRVAPAFACALLRHTAAHSHPHTHCWADLGDPALYEADA